MVWGYWHKHSLIIRKKMMEFNTYVRKPFLVEAVKITEDNISDIARLVGTLCWKPDGTPFIQVDRKRVPSIYRVFPGFYMTKMGNNIRCYSENTFLEQFRSSTPEIVSWVEFLNSEEPESAEV